MPLDSWAPLQRSAPICRGACPLNRMLNTELGMAAGRPSTRLQYALSCCLGQQVVGQPGLAKHPARTCSSPRPGTPGPTCDHGSQLVASVTVPSCCASAPRSPMCTCNPPRPATLQFACDQGSQLTALLTLPSCCTPAAQQVTCRNLCPLCSCLAVWHTCSARFQPNVGAGTHLERGP